LGEKPTQRYVTKKKNHAREEKKDQQQQLEEKEIDSVPRSEGCGKGTWEIKKL